MAKFFYTPFGQGGDIGTPVPDAAQPNGSVSYFAGFGSDYQLPLAGGGAALPINRVQFNSMMNDVTGAIQNIQTQGVFSWIGTSPSGDYSGNYPYPINALVYYTDGNIYQSLISNNQDVPGATLNWLNLSINSGIPIGSILDYAGLGVPTNCLICNGAAVSRTTYANLFAALTISTTGNTHTSTTVDGLSTTGNIQAGFYVSGPGVQAGTIVTVVNSGTSVTLSLPTTTTVVGNPLVFAPWGIGDGSTTFNVPDLLRAFTLGAGGSGSAIIGATLGNYGGSETYTLTIAQMPSHNHPGSTANSGVVNATGGNFAESINNVTQNSLNIAYQGGGQPYNVMPPAAVVLKVIKFQ